MIADIGRETHADYLFSLKSIFIISYGIISYTIIYVSILHYSDKYIIIIFYGFISFTKKGQVMIMRVV